MPRADVCAVIPAYQCVATVGAVVAGVRRHLDRVVVISDGSIDGTAAAARQAGAEVIELAENHGKGFALRRGIVRALEWSSDAILLLDADGQHDPEDLPAFIAAWDAERPDLVVGCRLEDRDGIPGARFWTNYIGSRVLSWMTGRELSDSQSGYRLLSARLARRLRLVSDGYAVESEMLIKAAQAGAEVAHVRVRTIYNGGESHFRPVFDTVRISCASIYFKVFDDADRTT
jgi:glycosyltransferase involved in cell wall biosynthesis